ncbi:RICIN domain-containing protein [Saccharothrix sp. HUAS TT1]|uniref:RICIN domain-containing protein n=1 Tax=unclassified Saccharothrix TaxID=2593673 RepID=UPI00345C3599
MTFRRALTAVVVAASALSVAPAADAREAAAPETVIRIDSVAEPGTVWKQSDQAGAPVIARPFSGSANEGWVVVDYGAIREQGQGLCATAEGGKVVGRACVGVPAQRWKVSFLSSGTVVVFQNLATAACVEHDGAGRPLLLANCNVNLSAQRWRVPAF